MKVVYEVFILGNYSTCEHVLIKYYIIVRLREYDLQGKTT